MTLPPGPRISAGRIGQPRDTTLFLPFSITGFEHQIYTRARTAQNFASGDSALLKLRPPVEQPSCGTAGSTEMLIFPLVSRVSASADSRNKRHAAIPPISGSPIQDKWTVLFWVLGAIPGLPRRVPTQGKTQ